MKRVLTSLACGLLLGAMPAAEPSKEQIQQAFSRYHDALIAHDGEAALPLISEASLDYFARMQRLALYASPEEVRRLDLVDQLQVLTFRHRVHPNELRRLEPDELFVYAVDRNWMGKETMARLSIGSIRMVDHVAEAEILRDGKATATRYMYVFERGDWRWDMERTFRISDRVLRMRASRLQKSGEEYLLSLLETETGRVVPETIWDPPFREPGTAQQLSSTIRR